MLVMTARVKNNTTPDEIAKYAELVKTTDPAIQTGIERLRLHLPEVTVEEFEALQQLADSVQGEARHAVFCFLSIAEPAVRALGRARAALAGAA